jgi:hypothetical protein
MIVSKNLAAQHKRCSTSAPLLIAQNSYNYACLRVKLLITFDH